MNTMPIGAGSGAPIHRSIPPAPVQAGSASSADRVELSGKQPTSRGSQALKLAGWGLLAAGFAAATAMYPNGVMAGLAAGAVALAAATGDRDPLVAMGCRSAGLGLVAMGVFTPW